MTWRCYFVYERMLRNKVGFNKEAIVGGGVAIIDFGGLVSMTKDSFNNLPMSNKRSLHKLTNMIHTTGDFKACNDDILEDSSLLELSIREGSTTKFGFD